MGHALAKFFKKMHDHAGKTPENALEHTRISSSKSALHHAGSRIQEKGKKTAPETTAEKRMPRTISGGLAGARGGGRPNKRIERIPRGRGLAKSWEHVCRSVKMGAVLGGQGPITEPSKNGAHDPDQHSQETLTVRQNTKGSTVITSFGMVTIHHV